MLYNYLSKSISTDIDTKVTTNTACYDLPIPAIDPNNPPEYCYDGVCFLKAIIDKTHKHSEQCRSSL